MRLHNSLVSIKHKIGAYLPNTKRIPIGHDGIYKFELA